MTSSAQYRERAEEARTRAETFRDPVARDILLRVAQSWESMANDHEQIVWDTTPCPAPSRVVK